MKKKSISNSLSHSQWRSENSIFHPKITMVRELEVKKKNGRRRAAASGLINFSTLSKFFFSFLSSSSQFIHEEEKVGGICSSNGMLSLPSHLSHKFYSRDLLFMFEFLF